MNRVQFITSRNKWYRLVHKNPRGGHLRGGGSPQQITPPPRPQNAHAQVLGLVGVPLHRQLAVGRLDVLFRRRPGDPEDPVIVLPLRNLPEPAAREATYESKMPMPSPKRNMTTGKRSGRGKRRERERRRGGGGEIPTPPLNGKIGELRQSSPFPLPLIRSASPSSSGQ